MVYMITYDLNSPGQNYKKVKQAIIDASTGAWITCSESSYLIQSYFQTADEIFSIIDPALDKNDNIFIVEVKVICLKTVGITLTIKSFNSYNYLSGL